MAEELQHLIDRIHKEAIEKSEREAAQIVARAKEIAAETVKEAEERAKAIIEKADRDSQVYVERSTRTLEQAARDLLITVGQGVENILQDIIGESVDKALDTATMQKMMLTIAQSYCMQKGAESRIEMLIGEKDQAEIVRFFADQYRQKLVRGIEIHTDNGILKGFKVHVVDEQVEHQFTQQAIAEALSNFLRQHLAEIVHEAAREASQG